MGSFSAPLFLFLCTLKRPGDDSGREMAMIPALVVIRSSDDEVIRGEVMAWWRGSAEAVMAKWQLNGENGAYVYV